MAVVVHVTGPDFLDEENQKVFARIEESIRQYSTHTREAVHLIRRPLLMKYDHFVILWTQGAALVGLFPFGGIIRGSRRGTWTSERPHSDLTRTDRDRSSIEAAFDNPYEVLTQARREFTHVLRISPPLPIPTATVSSVMGSQLEPNVGSAPAELPQANIFGADLEDRLVSDLQLVALFTHPVTELRLEESLWDKTFTPMPAEYAISRTMLHTPNLLRAIDRQSAVYSNAELQTIADALERQSTLHRATPEIAELAPMLQSRGSRARRRKFVRTWGISLALLIAVIGYYIIRSTVLPKAKPNADTTAATSKRSQTLNMLVIELPSDVQLLVSSNVYQTRSDLDRALAHGEGQRYLPSNEQTIVLDSVTFAKGVYGYFKVDNTWRKGKLLQTFQPSDTIHIDNFLPPLP